MRGEITINGKKMTVTELVEAYCELKDLNNQLEFKLKEADKTIDDLERELRVKDDLLTIKNAISNEPTEEHSARTSVEWYEDRYQSDCITINQLHTTIDVLTDKLARLRGQMGL